MGSLAAGERSGGQLLCRGESVRISVLLGSSGGSLGGLGVSVVSCLSLLDVLGEDLVVLGLVFLGLLESVDLLSLDELLSSQSLLGHESLDLGGLVESLVTLLDFSANNVLSNIVLLSEGEDLADVVGTLGSESAGLVSVSNTFDLSITLLHNA